MPNFTQAYQSSTGRVDIFAAQNLWSGYNWDSASYGDIMYVGTCEQYPLVQIVNHWNPVFNDASGPLVPFDKEWQGCTGLVAMDLNKLCNDTLNVLNQIPFSGLNGQANPEGTETFNCRGQLKMLNGLSFTLWLVYANYGLPQAFNNINPGRVLFNCSIPEEGFDPTGARTLKKRVIVEADPTYIASATSQSSSSTSANLNRGFATYSDNPLFFPNFPTIA